MAKPAPPDDAKERRRRQAAAATSWEAQAQWYDERMGEDGDANHREVVVPAILRQLPLKPNQRVLDVGCGTGVITRALAAQGVSVTGVDAAKAMIARAKERAMDRVAYQVADARSLDDALAGQTFHHAVLALMLQDLTPIDPVLAAVARHLEPDGHLIIVLTHPCFRIPKASIWGWDPQRKVQFRRIDGYLTPRRTTIRTNPGQGELSAESTSFHRPLQTYLNAIGQAGLAVVGCEEPVSTKQGTAGPRQAAEERSGREIPLFLLLHAVRIGKPPAVDG